MSARRVEGEGVVEAGRPASLGRRAFHRRHEAGGPLEGVGQVAGPLRARRLDRRRGEEVVGVEGRGAAGRTVGALRPAAGAGRRPLDLDLHDVVAEAQPHAVAQRHRRPGPSGCAPRRRRARRSRCR